MSEPLRICGKIDHIDMFDQSYEGLQEQNLINKLLTEYIYDKLYKPEPCVDADALLAIKCLCYTSSQIDTYLTDFRILIGTR